MKNITTGFTLILAFFLQISMAQSQDLHLIYDQVVEMQDEFSKEMDVVFLKNSALPIPSDSERYVRKAEYFQLDGTFVDQTKRNRPNTLSLEIPFEGKKLYVQLYKKDITTDTYKVKAVSGKQTEATKSIFYRGILKGNPNSLVSLSMTNSGLRMTVTDESGNIEINKIDEDLYAAYRVSDSKHDQDTGCSTSDNEFLNKLEITEGSNSDSRTGACIEVYIECDFDSYNTNGSSIQNTEDWALSILNEVGILYDNVGIPLVVSDILVYDQPDPYLAGSDSGDMLGLMGSVIGNDYVGRLAHVLSTRSVGGGIAYLDVLCQFNGGGSFGPYAVSGSMNGSTIPYPVYSWNVMVVAHELGHNIGSLHTHSCVWNGNSTQIDDCGNQATDQGDNSPCYDENNPILPAAGSIMSYCHLIGNIGISFNVGFHPQVASLLFDRYTNASCVTGENCGGVAAPIADFSFTQLNVCNPSEVQFTDQSLNNPSIFEWEFPGGTPVFSLEQNPYVVYSEPGFYNVTLTASNFIGEDVVTKIQIIEVIETPELDFDTEIEDGTMKFINQTSGQVISYFWDFGDGNSSTEENPCYAFEEEGSHLVTLTVQSICGQFVVEKYVDFFTPPTAAFEVDTTMGCVPLIVNFMNQSSANTVDYHWTFEGGSPETSTEENPSVAYDSAGVFDVTLVVANDLGEDTLSMADYISVEVSPTSDFDYAIDSLDVLFTNLSTNYDTLTWDFGDGNTSTMINPSHTYDEEGTYDLSLTVSNMCDTITTVQTLVLSLLPQANYTANATAGCLPFTVEYSNGSSANTDTWEWSFPGGTPSSSTEENPTIIYNETGNFIVILIASNESGTDTLSESNLIAVSDIPTADFGYTTNVLEVTFTDSSLGYESILWDFGDGNSSIEMNPVHSFNVDGSYEVILTTTNACGSNTSIQTILVSSLPTANFTASIVENCVPFVVEFSNNSSSNVNAWDWNFPGGTPSSSTEENPVISYEDQGIYDVSLTVTSLAGKDTLIMDSYITSLDMPIAHFEYSALSEFEYSFTNFSIDGNSYSWDFGDGMVSTEENPIHIFADYGTYEVVLTTTNECGDEVHQKDIEIIATSINEIENLKDIKVFPNPNSGEFNISLNSLNSGEVNIEIYNTLGQSILKDKFQISSGTNNKAIDLQNPVPGVYLLSIRSGGQSYVSKMFLD